MKHFLYLIKDLLFILKGKFISSKAKDYKFAFLVHARDYKDIYRKYKFFKFLPKSWTLFLMKNFWPISVSRVTGLKDINGSTVEGFVIGITMTAKQMMSDRPSALRKIRQAVYLAKGRGAKIVGLGGLTSSLSWGGKKLTDIDINITTGHGYTAYNVCENLFSLSDIFGIPKEKTRVAIVGAAGSVGSTCALILARAGFNLVLIDLKRKTDVFDRLVLEIKNMNTDISVETSENVVNIRGCQYIITATNAPEALITKDIVEDGMVIIDDAQPSDIERDVLKLENVLVIEAGVVHTPGINSNFDYGLKEKTDNFCCMAELLILASHLWDKHYIIDRATIEHVDQISLMGKKLGFKLAKFQNFLESISPEKIEHMKKVINNRHIKI